MLDLFESKNKRLVKKWKKEHEQLIILANKVLSAYVKGNDEETKKELRKFIDVAMEHLSDEDIELYKILHDPEQKDEGLKKYIDQYYRTFKNTKSSMMRFLAKYARPETPLDDEFFDTFEKIAQTLRSRIDFEEHNLYFRLSLS